MGPGEAEKGVGDGKEVVTCSVCLEAVTGGGGRATARLLCRHQFHLDCIGSAFNVKGVMECPNCREVEKGCWLYANGPHTPCDVSMGERIHDGELSTFHHLEMPFGVHWCPIGRLATIPLPFEPAASNSTIQSLVPLYPRAPVSINQQDYYHNLQNAPGSMVPPMPQVGGLRSIRLAAQPLPDHARYFLFPPISGQNTMMGGDEIIPRHQFYTLECERFTPYPLTPFHVESSGWRPFAQPTNGGRPESLIRGPICLARMHS